MAKVKTIKGHTIKYQKDNWGGRSYFVYDPDGRQLLDAYDTQEEAEQALKEYLM